MGVDQTIMPELATFTPFNFPFEKKTTFSVAGVRVNSSLISPLSVPRSPADSSERGSSEVTPGRKIALHID